MTQVIDAFIGCCPFIHTHIFFSSQCLNVFILVTGCLHTCIYWNTCHFVPCILPFIPFRVHPSGLLSKFLIGPDLYTFFARRRSFRRFLNHTSSLRTVNEIFCHCTCPAFKPNEICGTHIFDAVSRVVSLETCPKYYCIQQCKIRNTEKMEHAKATNSNYIKHSGYEVHALVTKLVSDKWALHAHLSAVI